MRLKQRILRYTSKEFLGKTSMIRIIKLLNENQDDKLFKKSKTSSKSNKFNPEVYISLFDKLTLNSSDYLPFK